MLHSKQVYKLYEKAFDSPVPAQIHLIQVRSVTGAYWAFKDLFVEGLSLEGLVCLRGLRHLVVLVRSPVLGGKVRGVGLRQRACLCPWQIHLPHPKQHISTAPDCRINMSALNSSVASERCKKANTQKSQSNQKTALL